MKLLYDAKLSILNIQEVIWYCKKKPMLTIRNGLYSDGTYKPSDYKPFILRLKNAAQQDVSNGNIASKHGSAGVQSRGSLTPTA